MLGITWDKATKEATNGDYPVFLVGAGFPLALLDPQLPSTGNLIETTATKHGSDFPLISALYQHLGNNTRLDDVWETVDGICKIALNIPCAHHIPLPFPGPWFVRQALPAYNAMPSGRPMKILFAAQNQRTDKNATASIVLGVELKRMVALHYEQSQVHLASPVPQHLKYLIDSVPSSLWVSFNYDLVVESLLDACLSTNDWRYAFQGVFESDYWDATRGARHVVVKPHGSLNLLFDTTSGIHSIGFCDKTQRLATCDWNVVGCYGNPPNAEKRPCVIGYLPDSLKDETNTPGSTAEPPHDFCKWNLSHAGLSLHRASAMFILGYSRPVADTWMWARINGLPNKTILIFVASRGDSNGIVARLKTAGFNKSSVLGNGDIS